MTAVFTSYFPDRPAAKSAFCSGQCSQLEDTCGGDRCYLFVGCINVAACSARWHSPIRNTESRIPSLTPTKLPTHLTSMPACFSSLRCGQTSCHECVLKWATPIHGRVDAAATVVTYSLEATLSSPVQRDGKSSASDCLNALIDPEHQHRMAYTHSARR